MKIVFSPHYTLNLKHKFDTSKFEKIVKLLLKRKIIKSSDIIKPYLPAKKDIFLAHSKKWVEKLLDFKVSEYDILRAEIPINKKIIYAHLLHVGGTILASELALKTGIGIHCGGGAHHAHRDYGAGFCLINDIAVAVKKLLYKKRVSNVLIVDLDVHQGDGSADIFKADKNVFTFSIHQKDIYPPKKEKSSMDVELSASVKGREYIKVLKENLATIFKKFFPDFIIYNAGADVYKQDRLGGFKLDFDDIMERDKIVFYFAKRNGIPIVVVLSGGYAKNPDDTVKVHYNTIKTAIEIFEENK